MRLEHLRGQYINSAISYTLWAYWVSHSLGLHRSIQIPRYCATTYLVWHRFTYNSLLNWMMVTTGWGDWEALGGSGLIHRFIILKETIFRDIVLKIQNDEDSYSSGNGILILKHKRTKWSDSPNFCYFCVVTTSGPTPPYSWSGSIITLRLRDHCYNCPAAPLEIVPSSESTRVLESSVSKLWASHEAVNTPTDSGPWQPATGLRHRWGQPSPNEYLPS